MHDLVKATGPVPCTGMIVGEAPGAEEAKQGRAFVGPSGKLLNMALEAADFSRELVYVTNTYKSRPPGNRNPTPTELEAHRSLFHKELKDVAPSVILALGRVAFDYVLLGSSNVPTERYSISQARHLEFEAYGRLLLV